MVAPIRDRPKALTGQRTPKVVLMSTESDHAREIAARIARRVTAGPSANDRDEIRASQAQPQLTSELAAVRAGLNELQKKIAQLEAKVSSESTDSRAISS